MNGIDGDPERSGQGLKTHTLAIPAVTALQEAYVRQVVETVGDLDNVLYEITNESGGYSTAWQYHMIDFVHACEQEMPRQHPVGMTFQFARENPGTNADLFASPAEWISPNPEGGYREDPPAADGRKVIISDTDHLWGIGGNRAWVWKSFCRGMNPIFMDPYREVPKKEEWDMQTSWTDHLSDVPSLDPQWDPVRLNLGYTRRYAERMDLAKAVPRDDLASTQYCLAQPGVDYLVYLPEGGEVEVDLSAAAGDFAVEWLNPETGDTSPGAAVSGGRQCAFTAPFAGDAILFIAAVDSNRKNRP